MPTVASSRLAIKNLQALHAHYSETARSIKVTLDLLTANDAAQAQVRMPGIIHAALAHEAKRATSKKKTGRPPGSKNRVRGRSTNKAKLAARHRSRAFLEKFDREEPRYYRFGGIGPLVRRGYLERRGDGYIRTDKPFDEAAINGLGEAGSDA